MYVYRYMHEDTIEHHDVMALERKLINATDRFQMLTRKSAEAIEYRSSAEHGKVPCQEINNHYNTHVLCRDIGPHRMCTGHRDVELVAPWKRQEELKYASLHIISILR
jgi:hypothetical protein